MKRFVIAIILVVMFSTYCLAVSSSKTTTYPDGRVVTEKEFKGIRGSASTLAIVVVSIAVCGGVVISILGIKIIVKAMKYGAIPDVSDLELDLSQKSLKLKKVSQGVIICLFGAGIIVLSVQQLSSLLIKDPGMIEVGSPAPLMIEAGSPAPSK